MWIMTTGGFVSAVVDTENSEFLKIRARDRRSLENMVEGLVRLTQRTEQEFPIITGAGTDYPYRVYVKREDFAAWMAYEVMSYLTYENFKNQLKHERGDAWAQTAGRMWWNLMDGITDDEGHRIGSPIYGNVLPRKNSDPGTWTHTDSLAADADYRSGVWDEPEPEDVEGIYSEDEVFLASERAALGIPASENDWFLSPQSRAALRLPLPQGAVEASAPSKGRRKSRQKKDARRHRQAQEA